MLNRLFWVALVAFAATACTKTVVLKEDDPLQLSASPPKPEPPPPPPPKRVEVKKEKIQVNETIHFDFNKATIREESFGLMDEITQVVADHPELLKIRIEGHTDNVGSHKYNMDLSKRRADAVRDYLVNKGIDAGRLISEGYAFDNPIAPNDTEEGRAQNRRVEFNILERSGDTAGQEEAEAQEPEQDPEQDPKPEPAAEGDSADDAADEAGGDQ